MYSWIQDAYELRSGHNNAFYQESRDVCGFLTSAHGSPASSGQSTNGLGGGGRQGGGKGQQAIKLSFGEGSGDDESETVEAASAQRNRGQNFINCVGGLIATHVGSGAEGAGNGHRIMGMDSGWSLGGLLDRNCRTYDQATILVEMERRTWNTPMRERWNPVIHQCLRGIDYHNELYFKTGDAWHLEKASYLRRYVIELKEMIKREEKQN